MTVEELKKLKTAALRKMAEGKELPGWEDMDKKALVEALAEKQPASVPVEPAKPEAEAAKTEPAPVKTEPVQEKPVNSGMKEERTAVGSKAERMKETLAAQPKVRVLVPLEPGESKGTTTSVILNGYRLNIKKGVYVDVPQQVADVLMTSNNQTVEALNVPERLSGDGPRELQ